MEMKMKTRIIHTRFWEDEKVAGLSLAAKLLFLYLFTNSRINMVGIYELTDRIIEFETGLDNEMLLKAKEELQDSQRVMFNNDWIFVVNAVKYSNYSGPLNDKARDKEIHTIPEEIKNYFETLGFEIPYQYTMDNLKTNKQKIENNETQNNNKEMDLDVEF